MRGEGEGERGEGDKDLSFVVANAHPNAPRKVSKEERDTNDYNMYNENYLHTHTTALVGTSVLLSFHKVTLLEGCRY